MSTSHLSNLAHDSKPYDTNMHFTRIVKTLSHCNIYTTTASYNMPRIASHNMPRTLCICNVGSSGHVVCHVILESMLMSTMTTSWMLDTSMQVLSEVLNMGKSLICGCVKEVLSGFCWQV